MSACIFVVEAKEICAMELGDMNISMSVEILGSYSNVDEDPSLLAYDTSSIGTQLPAFDRSLLLPSSGSKLSKKNGHTGRMGNLGSVIVMVVLHSRQDHDGTGVRCLVQKGNSEVRGCNGSVEMGNKARMGWNVVT